MIRKLVLLLLLFMLGAILAYQELERRWQQPLLVPGEGAVIDVGPGDSLRAVARSLHREGLVPYPNMLIVYARVTGADLQIKPGEYRLPPAITAQGLLELLVSGKVIQYKVTFPEGINLQQALALLASQDQLVLSLEGRDDPRLQELVEPYTHPEGLFFPDTYLFPRDTTDMQLLQRAHEKMVAVLEQEWLEREADLPYKTPYEALIMASIIERETSLPEEREQIAGVFVRRLQAGMRLQTDPTVIYGAGEEFDGNLRREHLEDTGKRALLCRPGRWGAPVQRHPRRARGGRAQIPAGAQDRLSLNPEATLAYDNQGPVHYRGGRRGRGQIDQYRFYRAAVEGPWRGCAGNPRAWRQRAG